MTCKYCGNTVQPVKKFSWGWFLVLCVTGVGGLFYWIYYMLKPENQCPVCGKKLR